MDLITHFPMPKGFGLGFTIVYRFSKYVTFITCKTTCTAPNLARTFYDYIVCNFGMPKEIVSNRDIRLLSKF